MKRSEDLRNQIEEWEGDLTDLCTMSEEDACSRFNVDAKYEAIALINMELQSAYKALDEQSARRRRRNMQGGATQHSELPQTFTA